MSINEMLDLIALCASGRRGLRRTLSFIRKVREFDRRGRAGIKTGYKFYGMDFECVDPQHFAFLFTEIFVAARFFFRSSNERPYIVDGGVNIGLSVAYFKTLFPGARIVGFEPHPEAFQVAQRNFQRNKFRDVTLHECALDEKPGVVQLSYIPGEIMASTTTNRLCVRGQIPLTVSVKTAQLSPFLEEDVDFLKLDIEGAEQRVLKEAGNKLRRIKYMFIEFHQTRGDKSNSLPVSVELLENNGFDYLITSTLSTRTTAAVAPLPECGPVCSFYIFAKRVD